MLPSLSRFLSFLRTLFLLTQREKANDKNRRKSTESYARDTRCVCVSVPMFIIYMQTVFVMLVVCEYVCVCNAREYKINTMQYGCFSVKSSTASQPELKLNFSKMLLQNCS